MMKKPLIFALLLCFSSTIVADSIKRINLIHRDAVATKSLLDDLFKGDVSMVVDGNGLLVRGETGDIQAIATMIKRIYLFATISGCWIAQSSG